jgi:hypothetical protein
MTQHTQLIRKIAIGSLVLVKLPRDLKLVKTTSCQRVGCNRTKAKLELKDMFTVFHLASLQIFYLQ